MIEVIIAHKDQILAVLLAVSEIMGLLAVLLGSKTPAIIVALGQLAKKAYQLIAGKPAPESSKAE